MKSRSKTSTRKVVLTLFFDISGPILVKWMPKDTTMNAVQYVDTLMKLHSNIKNGQKGRLSAGIMLLYDNTRSYMVGLIQPMLTTLKLEVLTHPVYRPDLSLYDYEIFGSKKTFLVVNVFLLMKRSKKRSRNGCYKSGQNFGAM